MPATAEMLATDFTSYSNTVPLSPAALEPLAGNLNLYSAKSSVDSNGFVTYDNSTHPKSSWKSDSSAEFSILP